MDSEKIAVSLLGIFALRRAGERQPLHFTGNTKRLLMLLASQANRGFRREHVIEEIWPTKTQARGRSALNTAVSRLRARLQGYPGLTLEMVDDVIRLKVCPPASTDVIELEEALSALRLQEQSTALTETQRNHLVVAAEACGREFLEGCDDHWILPLRERYSAHYLHAMTLLMHDATLAGDCDRALERGALILERDPFQEGVQRRVMELYVLNGQRARAIRQYQRLVTQLADELDIAPMAETTALYQSILSRSSVQVATAPSPPEAISAELFLR